MEPSETDLNDRRSSNVSMIGPPMVLTPGTKLGPYEIVAQLGSGGMGVV